ncbi:hypothetical protein NL676_009414 [Syzygium grande]|nr:hypothetical protein NL676_009414 [Syzygium grande]
MPRGHGLEYEALGANALNESGLTPLDVLTVSQRGVGDREIREILARAGAKHGRGRSKFRPRTRMTSRELTVNNQMGNRSQMLLNQ